MDLNGVSTRFKLAKGARYLRLYGPGQTVAKVRAYRHISRPPIEVARPSRADAAAGGHIGILGCGRFAYSNVAYFLRREHKGSIRGVMDRNLHRAAALGDRYGASYWSDDAEELIEDPAIDLVYIVSNHASHAEYAIRALEAGKHVHIEKPHVVSLEQLERLDSALAASGGKVALGFNRPVSPMGREIKRVMASQPGPAMLNWFVAGHPIPDDHWYLEPDEGGRAIGNLCHWTDFAYSLIEPASRYPLKVTPVSRPDDAGVLSVGLEFGDGSLATISLTTTGETFEGVRERFTGHRGDALIAMDDFQRLRVDVNESRFTTRSFFRDPGHRAAVERSYQLSRGGPGCSREYVRETGQLFLAARDALETGEARTLSAPGSP